MKDTWKEPLLPEIQEELSKEGLFRRWLAVEKALANAQAALGIIPEVAAREIQANARVEQLDMEQYDVWYQKTGHPMVSLLKLLEKAVGDESAQYIHLGATTQDIIDTAMVLAVKKMLERTESKLCSMIVSVCDLCETYAQTPMMGRTHNIQALPITFGYKAAVWGGELYRCLERIRECKKRVLVLQLSGAVGSMVSFGEDGAKIQEKMAEELNLQVPDICWHASRDRFVEFADQMALVGCALGRIAQEVYLLMGTEFGELSEYWGKDRVGSSTMPHKVNPTSTQHMKAKAMHLRYHAAQLAELSLVDHERDMQHFIGERKLLEEVCLYAAELLDRGDELLATLVVNEEQMRLNLDRLNGLTQSEHVMFALGKKIGKQHAHELVNKIAVHSFMHHLNFEDELCSNEQVSEFLEPEEIHQLLDPMRYIGKCPSLARSEAAFLREKLKNMD